MKCALPSRLCCSFVLAQYYLSYQCSYCACFQHGTYISHQFSGGYWYEILSSTHPFVWSRHDTPSDARPARWWTWMRKVRNRDKRRMRMRWKCALPSRPCCDGNGRSPQWLLAHIQYIIVSMSPSNGSSSLYLQRSADDSSSPYDRRSMSTQVYADEEKNDQCLISVTADICSHQETCSLRHICRVWLDLIACYFNQPESVTSA